jgi:FG-GAP-like repeat
MKSRCFVSTFVLTVILFTSTGGAAEKAAMTRIAYNNPGLTVDLGVGLWAWPLPMDYNGDGRMDLVVVCTDKPYNGTWFFENSGKNDPETRLPIFKPAVLIGKSAPSTGISYVTGKPVVSATASVKDGDLLRFIGNVYPDFLKTQFEQPVNLNAPEKIHLEPGNIRQNQWQRVDFDGDGVLDLTVGIDFWGDYGWDNAFDAQGNWHRGPLHGYIYLMRNTGTNEKPVYAVPVKVTAGGKPVDPFGMPSPMWGDFSGTGKLDLICGEFREGFTFYQNTGSRTAPVYAAGKSLSAAGSTERLHMDLCMITPVAVDFNGDGRLDIVCGDEDGRVAFIENTGKAVDGVPQFLAPRYFKQFAADVKFGALVTPYAIDWDGDGREDFICGNSSGHIAFIKNLGGDPVRWAAPELLSAGGVVIREQAGLNGSIQGPAEAKWGYSILSVADWDGDGLPDIVTNGIWGKIIWYKNIGTRTAPKLAAGRPVQLEPGATSPKPAWNWWNPTGRDLITQWRTTPQMADWNGDKLMDLVMADHEGYLALYERRAAADGSLTLAPAQRIFWGDGKSNYDSNGKPTKEGSGLLRLNDGDAGKSGRRTFCIVDWDGDGKPDLLVNSNPNVNFLRGRGLDAQGRYVFHDEGPVSTHQLAGHATKPTTVDLTGSGRRDLVIGAEDGFLYLFDNSAKK